MVYYYRLQNGDISINVRLLCIQPVILHAYTISLVYVIANSLVMGSSRAKY